MCTGGYWDKEDREHWGHWDWNMHWGTEDTGIGIVKGGGGTGDTGTQIEPGDADWEHWNWATNWNWGYQVWGYRLREAGSNGGCPDHWF